MSLDSLGPLHVRVRDPLSRSERGRRGAVSRWGPPRVVRLDDFDPEERLAIIAAVDARRAAKAAHQKAGPVSETTEAGQEARGDSHEPSAA